MKRVCFAVAVLFLLSTINCVTGADKDVKKSVKSAKVELPEWLSGETPRSPDFIYAVGSAEKSGLAMARESAVLAARAELSKTIEVKVDSFVKDYVENSKSKNRSSMIEFTQSFSKQISQSVIIGSFIKDSWLEETRSAVKYYCLLAIKSKDLEKSIAETKDKLGKNYPEIEKELDGLVKNVKEKLKIEEEKIREETEAKHSGNVSAEKQEPEVSTGKEPAWIKKYPTDKKYYVGIGNGSTLQGGQDQAINSLVSQIKLKIKSELNDYFKEVNGVTEEEASQSIKITVRESIEDVEIVDVWYKEGRGYWVYCRLNIEEYKRKQLEKMENAKLNALDFLSKCDAESDPALAFKFAFMGYYNLAKYVTNALKADYNGKKVIVVNELIGRMQKILSQTVVSSKQDGYEIDRISAEPVKSYFEFKTNNKPLANMPVQFKTNGIKADMSVSSTTDGMGKGFCVVNGVVDKVKSFSLYAQPDFTEFLSGTLEYEDEQDFYLNKITQLGLPVKEVTISVKKPVFGFELVLLDDMKKDTRNISKFDAFASNIKATLSDSLDADFTDGKAKFSFKMICSGTTTTSDYSGQVFTRLTVTFKILDNSTSREIYSKASPEVKGGSVTDIKSVQKAIDKYLEEYNEQMIEELLNSGIN
ncbi:MAG TPA: LPP20 family lipoprotein [Spirochaetota bacterium]|nr:LPP20 family lipoprotein [Spirochaetota bacterium]